MLSQSASDRSVALPAAELCVYLLGPPYVTWAGHTLRIARRQVRAILYYLASNLQPSPRERLTYLFWPDISDSSARCNLSHLLTHLRHDLPCPDILLAEEDHIALDPQRTWSDTVASRRLQNASLLAYPKQSFGQVMDLYRGPFLASLSLPASPDMEVLVNKTPAWNELIRVAAQVARNADKQGRWW